MTWTPLDDGVNSSDWKSAYGAKGEKLAGMLITPIRSPRGEIIGFEGRRIDRKEVTRFLLPQAAWNPVWLGMRPSVMEKIWAGGDVWLGEGIFDVYPLEWAVPKADAVLGCGRAKLTEKQVEFLRRFCQGWVHVVFDNDETGRKGTHGWRDETGKHRWGAVETLKRVGIKCRAIPYTGGKDPGEIWDQQGLKGVQATFQI